MVSEAYIINMGGGRTPGNQQTKPTTNTPHVTPQTRNKIENKRVQTLSHKHNSDFNCFISISYPKP
eukprot:31749-Amorphochlora_amoeboformis.AAC.1